MNNTSKASQIEDKLVVDIESLDSIRFEKMCYILIDAITEKKLIHRGTTAKGQPVKSTVDSYSDDGLIVGEYSVDKQYFQKLGTPKSKPVNDVLHAKSCIPNVQSVYLFAGNAASPSEGTDMANVCQMLENTHTITIKWFDSRQIATYIIKNLLTKVLLIRNLYEFLPSLELIYSSNINTANLPDLPRNYVIDDEVVSSAIRILDEKNKIYITGISGLGKTLLSVKIIESLKKFNIWDAVYFVDAGKIENVRDLESVDLEMAGQKINLLGTIKYEKAIFIIDDLNSDIENIVMKISENLNPNAFVLFTSQITSDYAQQHAFEFHLGFPKKREAERILNFGLAVNKKCPADIADIIWNKTNGHPMLLIAINKLSSGNVIDWAEIKEDLQNVADFEVETGRKFVIKLLSRHKEILSKEFMAIKWLDNKYISKNLLQKLISSRGLNNLKSRSLMHTMQDTLKLHDIIFECINELEYDERENTKNAIIYTNKFYAFLSNAYEGKYAGYYKSLHMHENKVISLAKVAKEPGKEWYFYLQVFPNDDMKILEEFDFDDDLLNKIIVGKDNTYKVKTIVEYIEYKCRKLKHAQPEEFQRNSQKYIASFELMRDNLKETDLLYKDILHHQGKLYNSIGDIENALKCYNNILSHSAHAYETKLQVARIYKKDPSADQVFVSKTYVEILDTYIAGNPISMSVVLATYTDIYFLKNADELKKRYFLDKFFSLKQAISSMAVASFDQPYNVLATVVKYFTYEHPEKVIELVEAVPIPSVEIINKKNYFDVAQMYKEMGKAILWSDSITKSYMPSDYFELAEKFYILCENEGLNTSYKPVQRAENLILCGKQDKALDYLRIHPYEKNEHWNYRMGHALEEDNQFEPALKYCEQAIFLLKETKDSEKYLSSFYHKAANLRKYLGNPNADEYYEEALKWCRNQKYENAIRKDMATR